MAEIYLDKLLSQNANWLSVRQSLVASNIANANTPGFKAMDVRKMAVVDTGFIDLLKTHKNHLATGVGSSMGIATIEDTPWEVNHSGGTVSLPKEMIKSGEIASDYQLNTAIRKSFHRMLNSVFGS